MPHAGVGARWGMGAQPRLFWCLQALLLLIFFTFFSGIWCCFGFAMGTVPCLLAFPREVVWPAGLSGDWRTSGKESVK